MPSPCMESSGLCSPWMSLHEAEVDDLRDVRFAALLREDDVGRLDVAVDQADAVRLAEGGGDLVHEVGDALGRLRAVDLDDLVQRGALEQLHRVVEDAVRRAAVVENRDGVRMRQPRGELHLALEAAEVLLADLVRQEQLDRARAAQHAVLRA